MRLSPWDQKYGREPKRQETRPFDFDGEEYPITLIEADEFDLGLIFDKAQEYVRLYVRDGDDEPLKLIAPDMQQVRLSEHQAHNIAGLEVMQVPDEGDAPYSMLDWCGIALRFPETWKAILGFQGEMSRKALSPGKARARSAIPEPSGPPSS